jgi:arylsulfatase A-like enzyme
MENKIIILIVSALFILAGCQSSLQDKSKHQNVIFILTDQWRADALGYSGDPNVKTPNLDAFANKAVNFSNTVSVCPVCTPYRASLLTGKFPTTTGMMLNDIYLPLEENCMAEIFVDAGYKTAYIGKWHLDGHGRKNNVAPERRQGFQFWMADECCHTYDSCFYYENSEPGIKYWEGYSEYAKVKAANDYLRQSKEDNKPFLLFLSLATPHFPHNTAPDEYKELYTKEKVTLKDNVPEEARTDRLYNEIKGYYGHCTATDKAIGDLLNQIWVLGLDKNSIIIFTSDHGEMMGSHGINPGQKQFPYDESIRVPFLISFPGLNKHDGITNRTPVTTPDILPTLLSMCKIDIPATIEGEDLSSIFLNPEKEIERAALITHPCPFAQTWEYPGYRSIRTMQYTYVKTASGPFMLFDNLTDPQQMKNLVNNAEMPDVWKKLDDMLQTELKKIDDEPIREKEFYLKKFNLEPNGNHYTYEYNDFEKADSPKIMIKKNENN